MLNNEPTLVNNTPANAPRPVTGRQLFVAGLVLAAIGGGALLVGIGAAFGRAGNEANLLALLGIVLLVVGGVVNLAAVVVGLRSMLTDRVFSWWWVLSVGLAIASVAGGLVAWNL